MPTAAPLRRRTGFSLIEILIVISIIALLVAMVVPVIGMVRASARTVGCMNNLNQIGIALRGWSADHENAIVTNWDDAMGRNTPEWGWQGQIRPYLFSDNATFGERLVQTMRCPEMRGEMIWNVNDPTTYGKNIRTGQCPPPQNNNGYPVLKFARIVKPNEAMMIGDTAPYGWDTSRHPRDLHPWIFDAGIWGVAFNHRGKGPFLMADGHVEMRAEAFGMTWPDNGDAAFGDTVFWNVASPN